MYNIYSYLFYLLLTLPVIVIVGWKCFQVGKIYLLDVFHDSRICNSVNRLLLTGYYLLNIGYTTFSLSGSNQADTPEQLLVQVSTKISVIVLLIGTIHYMNIGLLNYFRKQIISTFKN